MKTPLAKEYRAELGKMLCYGLPYVVFFFLWRILLPVEFYVSAAADVYAGICFSLLIVPYLIWLFVPLAVIKAIRAKRLGDMFRGWKRNIRESWRIFSPDMPRKKRIIIGICWLILLARVACITLFILSPGDRLQEIDEYVRENLYSRVPIPSAYSLYLYIALTVGFYFSYLLLLWAWESKWSGKKDEAGE